MTALPNNLTPIFEWYMRRLVVMKDIINAHVMMILDNVLKSHALL